VKRLLARSLVAGALAASSAFSFADDEAKHVVVAPHYGDTLFYFWQDKWFDAITGLMVSQHFDRLHFHDDEAEVLRGGMLLSYGLHNEAGDVFAKLIERGAAPAVRDRAWYFLAKLRYQRGLIPEAEAALDKVEHPLVAGLEDDRQLLRAQLRLAREDYTGAAAILEPIKDSKNSGLFARFNLGVALVKSGDPARGNALLEELGKTPVQGEELKTLRDRANVALGFSALQDKKPAEARSALLRVRLVGPQSNKALLGFGWAAAELKNPKEALVPWMELAQRDSADAAVLEAKIAVPYAYAELGALGRAMDGYNEAVDLYDAEAKRLDESIAAIRRGALVCALLEHNPKEGMGAFGSIAELPPMPHAGHLAQLLAGHEFQESFKNLRDLQFLDRNLQGWSERLAVFADMLANRRQAYADRLPKILDSARQVGLPALERRREALATELDQAMDTMDGEAFADPRQRDLLTRLQFVQKALAEARDPELAERARRVAGALGWELAHDYPARVWDAKKALAGADKAIAEAKAHQAALAQAQIDEPAKFDRFAARLAELGQRVTALRPQIVELARLQQGQLQDLAIAELERQKERLDVYSGQARLAIAQLHDKAQIAGRTDTDAKR